ncbi:hypothetical protein ACFWIQ_17895 [Kitasatospora sp. NPDC127059]|uniref:hypothetical protein n=1 Tax=unclassified Kitasatospora TaxID=2633591 RepID=UPI003669D0F2
MISSWITGTDSSGYTHTAKIVTRGNDERYVECDSCDYQRRVSWGARDTAESHLWSTHGASGFHQRLAAGPWVAAGIALLLVCFFLAKAHVF